MPKELPVFLDDPARCCVKHGTVRFCWDGFEIALPIDVCITNIAECNRALAEWRLGSMDNGKVVRMPRKRH